MSLFRSLSLRERFFFLFGIVGVLSLTASALLAAPPAPPPLSAGFEPEAEEEGSEEHEKKEQRQLNLHDHADGRGRVRADLWRKGARQHEQMELAVTRPAPKVIPHVDPDRIGTDTAALSFVPAPASLPGGNGVQGVQWKQIGPAPLVIDAEQNYQGQGPDSGQVTDIFIDPRNTTDRTIYAASNDGGVWRTRNGGTDWVPTTDAMPSLSMGALAGDPVNPSIVYAGTGNIYNNGFFKGIGLYRSTDGGDTWAEVAGNAALTGRGIHDIVVPQPNVVIVATDSGLFRSIDGGATFGDNAPAFDNGSSVLGGFVTDLDLDTQNPTTTLFASVSGQGIFRSTDAGASFPTNLWAAGVTGAPAPASYQYVSFAQSTSDNGVTMYADTQSTGGTSRFGGFYKSTNSGGSWTDLSATVNIGGRFDSCQCGYDQTLGVDPQNPSRVYMGFQELWMSSDGALTFTNVSDSKIHWDHHELQFSPRSHWSMVSDATNITRVWAGQDGGLAYSDDAGTTWTHVNGAIATNLFRALDIGRGTGNNGWSYGGAQDTGTMHHSPAHTGTQWHEAINGDGGPTAVDWQDPENAYGSSNGGYIRTTDGGASWERPGATFPACTSLTSAPSLDPNNGANVFLWQRTKTGADSECRGGTSSFSLWRSTDTGVTFPAASAVAAFTQAVTAVATTPTDSNLMWVGLADGRAAFSTNVLAASPTFTTVNVPGRIADQSVQGITIDPTNTDRVIVVYQGFSNVAAPALTRHVFRTINRGTSWADIGGTAGEANQVVPDLPLNSVVVDPGTVPPTIIVATDLGILRSLDNGATWQRFGLGLPNVNATSLQIDYTVSPSLLRVGTYGRSAFELAPATGPLVGVNGDLAFGTVGVGQQETRPLQLYNTGSSDLHINGFTRSSGSTDFTIVSGAPTPVTVAPGDFVEYTIGFRPSSPGNKQASFQITSDDQFEPIKFVPASGTGEAGIIAVSGDLGYGTVARGTDATRDITIYNAGKGDLVISSVSFVAGSDPEFSVVRPPTPQTLAEGEHRAFTIRFAPPYASSGGARDGTLRISSDDPANPQVNIPASAIVGMPRTVIQPLSLHFADTPVDNRTVPSTATKQVTIFNEASCDLCDVKVTGLSIGGTNAADFGIVAGPSLPVNVAAGNQLTLTLRFNPSLEGLRTAALTVTTDDPAAASTDVPLEGSGLHPKISVQPGTLIFGPTVVDPACAGFCGSNSSVAVNNTGLAELLMDRVEFSGSSAFSGPGPSDPVRRVQAGHSYSQAVTFRPSGGPARRVDGVLHLADLMPLDPGNVEAKDVPLCGEAVGRGIRVLVVDRDGNPVPTATIKLASTGVTPTTNVNLKNLSLTTISPPTSCQEIKFHYENQNLPATDQSAPRGSYYTLTAQVGNRHSSRTFPLAVNEFKVISITVG